MKRLSKIFLYSPFAIFWLGMITIHPAQAQDKFKARLDLAYFNENASNYYLEAKVRFKEDRAYVPAEGVKLKLYQKDDYKQPAIAETTTLASGIGTFDLNPIMDTLNLRLNSMDMFVVLSESSRFEDTEKSISIQFSSLAMEVKRKDSITTAYVTFNAIAGGDSLIAVDRQSIKLYVDRYMGPLMLGSYKTDRKGYIKVDIPADLPQDINGELRIIAKVEKHKTFGNLSVDKTIQWDTPRHINTEFDKRSLWGTRDKTPLWLIIFPNLIILTIWGLLAYLVILLFRVRQAGKF